MAHRRTDRPTLLAALLLAALGPPGPARAQDAGVVRGRVADAGNLSPVAEAFVAQAGAMRGVLTDSSGIFALPLDPELPRAIRVVRLGYKPLDARIPPGGGRGLLNVMLIPDPVQLEGLTVLAKRLEQRRRGPYGVVDVLTREELQAAPEGTGFELLQRLVPFASPCIDDMNTEALCLGGRPGPDGPRRLRVCLDDTLVPPDMMETFLSDVGPRRLYMVEVYSLVGEVRLYTPAYVQRLLDGGGDVPPLSFGCTGPEGMGGRPRIPDRR